MLGREGWEGRGVDSFPHVVVEYSGVWPHQSQSEPAGLINNISRMQSIAWATEVEFYIIEPVTFVCLYFHRGISHWVDT